MAVFAGRVTRRVNPKGEAEPGGTTMTTVRIDCREIVDWNTFHTVFQEAMGFPAYYGRNRDAWIDCMTYVDRPDTGMTRISVPTSGMLVLQLDEADALPANIYEALVDDAAAVNWRRMDVGEPAVLALAFDRHGTRER